MFLVSELCNVTAAFEISYIQQRQPHSSVDILIIFTKFVEAHGKMREPSAHLITARMVRQ